MESSGWVLSGIDAAAAAPLLVGGVAKAVSPGPMRRALIEVSSIGNMRTGMVRIFAVAEVFVAISLSIPGFRVAASFATAVLGACFAAFGVLGLSSRAGAPCGCFGQAGHRPLGRLNIGTGLALMLVAPVTVAIEPPTIGADYTTATVLLTSGFAIGLCGWVNRRLMTELIWPARMNGVS